MTGREEVSGADPRGIRLHLPGGRVIACDLLRDPDLDAAHYGLRVWHAVPREPPGDVTAVRVTGRAPPGNYLIVDLRGQPGG